jgi:hypothetical protein
VVDVSDTQLITFLLLFTPVFLCFQISTIALPMKYHKLGLSFLVPAVTCFLMLCVYMVQQCTACSHDSEPSDKRTCNGILDCLIIFIFLSHNLYYLMLHIPLLGHIQKAEEKDHNIFVDFKEWPSPDRYLSLHVGILVCLSTVRLFTIVLNKFISADSSS